MQTTRPEWWRSRWWMPAFSLFLGTVVLIAFWVGGSLTDGLKAFAVMAAIALLFLVGHRSDTVRGLAGPGRDERWAFIDAKATAFTGTVLITAIIGLWLYEIARGHDGGPYGQLAAIAGTAYIGAIAWLRRRS